MTVHSEPGIGSTFTFYHPIGRRVAPAQQTALPEATTTLPTPRPVQPLHIVPRAETNPRSVPAPIAIPERGSVEDDRMNVEPTDRLVLVIEDDLVFARILLSLARDRGFKGLVATSGAEGLQLARALVPDAITLDIRLPDVDGWQMLEALKNDPATRSIPVHVISGEEEWQRALDAGAIAHLKKPVSEEAITDAFDRLFGYSDTRARELLLVEDDVTQLSAMANLVSSGEVNVTAVSTGAEALAALDNGTYDCAIVDLGLPDCDGIELIGKIKRHPMHAKIAIIVYTGRELTADEEATIRRSSESIIVKDVMSPERLLDETSYFLNQVESRSYDRRRSPRLATVSDLQGKTVLIVDDDLRNIYALTSALEDFDLTVLSAESGLDAIRLITERSDIDAVLMDIMMPEMDGYETIRRIRANPRFMRLPIIALTAKAMKGDRESCLAAGASEYISKPVDIDQLIALLRVWVNVTA